MDNISPKEVVFTQTAELPCTSSKDTEENLNKSEVLVREQSDRDGIKEEESHASLSVEEGTAVTRMKEEEKDSGESEEEEDVDMKETVTDSEPLPESDSEASSSSSEASASSSGISIEQIATRLSQQQRHNEAGSDGEDVDGSTPIRSKHELNALPPVPPVNVELLPGQRILPLGDISAVLGTSLVVQTGAEGKALEEGSVLWLLQQRKVLGLVDELFGPVRSPLYIVRFNSTDDIPSEATLGTAIGFCPEHAKLVIDMDRLRQKGYDASGADDEELGDDEAEFFSDDEKEAEARRMKKESKRKGDLHDGAKSGTGRGDIGGNSIGKGRGQLGMGVGGRRGGSNSSMGGGRGRNQRGMQRGRGMPGHQGSPAPSQPMGGANTGLMAPPTSPFDGPQFSQPAGHMRSMQQHERPSGPAGMPGSVGLTPGPTSHPGPPWTAAPGGPIWFTQPQPAQEFVFRAQAAPPGPAFHGAQGALLHHGGSNVGPTPSFRFPSPPQQSLGLHPQQMGYIPGPQVGSPLLQGPPPMGGPFNVPGPLPGHPFQPSYGPPQVAMMQPNPPPHSWPHQWSQQAPNANVGSSNSLNHFRPRPPS